MNLQERKDLLVQLGEYMLSEDEQWTFFKRKASSENKWFTPEFIELAVKNIAENYLQPEALQSLIDNYKISAHNSHPKRVGIVMAGNIPLVGIHDLLCVFLTGHIAVIKPSSKDEVLIPYLVSKMKRWASDAEPFLIIQQFLNDAEAYIATGSNNSSRYFEYYFRNKPNIIRKNRTSVAILTGNETEQELELLADDVHLYFGLGCRNITKIFVPVNYDFVPLLEVFRKYHYLVNHNKYKNNYDYNLAIHILNKQKYMTNDSIILVEETSAFSPISQLNYEYYTDITNVYRQVEGDPGIQCVVGMNHERFGEAQVPGICTFADRIDTIDFLLKLATNDN
jgi:hypothetical protein